MELSAELFVLDNLLMDLLMLRLAAAIGALRLRPVAAVLAAFLGAVYALLSMSALPQLTAPVPKLLLCAAASLPLVSAPRDLPRALLSLLAARGIETLRTADGTVRVTLSGGGVEAELLPD